MAKKSKIESLPTADEMLGHCFIAFGKGAGSYLISQAVLQAMINHYGPLLTGRASNWEQNREAMLINAEQLGRLCASKAGPNKSIEMSHYRSALIELRKDWTVIDLVRCPIRHHP